MEAILISKNEIDISSLATETNDTYPKKSQASERISALDGLRGLAILLVFIFHFTGFYASANYYLSPSSIGYSIVSFFRAGHIGVDLFFVVSGYLIARSLEINQNGFTFLKHRIQRLLPVHLAMCIYIAYVTHSWNLLTFLSNLAFVAPLVRDARIYNDVAWSLSWEWLFYLDIFIAAKLFIPGSSRRIFTLIMAVMIPISTQYIPALFPVAVGRFSGFLIGVGLAAIPQLSNSERSRLSSNMTAIAASVGVLTLMIIWNGYWKIFTTLPLDAGFYLAVSLCFAFLIRESFAKNGDMMKIFSFSPLRRLGKISYSFYLIHSVMIGTLLNNLNRFGSPTSFLQILFRFLIVLGITILVAGVSYSLLERPYFEKRVPFDGLFKTRRIKWLGD